MTPGHGHGSLPPRADARALRGALGLILTFMVVEVVVAFTAHSLALLADAGHMLTDAAAVSTALWVIRLIAKPATRRWTYGLQRAEILSAAVNGISLVAVAGIITVQAIQRLVHPSAVAGGAVLIVALVGAMVNAVATWLLSRTDRNSLNLEAAFQHIATDAVGFVATAVAGIVILTTGLRRADPVASLLVVALMVRAAWGLLLSSGRILLEGTPERIDLEAVRSRLIAADERVVDVHDLHAWALTSALPAMSAHVVIDDSCFQDGHAGLILDALQSAMRGDFDVAHSTLQLELAGHVGHEPGMH